MLPGKMRVHERGSTRVCAEDITAMESEGGCSGLRLMKMVIASIKTLCVALRHAQLVECTLLGTGERGELPERPGRCRLRVVQIVHDGDAHV